MIRAPYTAVTNDVRISVYPMYLDAQSSPEDNHFIWAYHVCIENLRDDRIQLRRRFWKITDSLGRIHAVSGGGVVGEQPILDPGESFEYTSGTPLSTPSGVMVGSYEMEAPNGRFFRVNVPAFSLDSPYQSFSLH